MTRRTPLTVALMLGCVGLVVAGCQPSEAPRVELPVVVDGSGLSEAPSDLGWTVEFDEARVVIVDLLFTTAGEVHDERRTTGAVLIGAAFDLLEAKAWAHPGHQQGGEVIGELPGAHVIDFANEAGRELGLATLIAGEYTALNFGLGRGQAQRDGLSATDDLLGHTAVLRGTASKQIDAATVAVEFTIVIDSPPDREIIGAPFEASVTEASAYTIGLRLLTHDLLEGDGLFDGVDFAALDEADGAADGQLLLVDPDASDSQQVAALSDAYYAIRREFQTHDLFDAVPHLP
ncbi:putative lipoprotein [Enhygromyxa salina]|uniref:Putative lipoprotein n=1 Tax=Enhygromyxa salina TaxID=215803 RepID=A0A0C2A784_9BACT|nr:hypothetical protein [Enhygromyxa salina]KIG19303.1 putative lipoprotein [Enhygromyxa salina]